MRDAALEDFDRRLLNSLQRSMPLAREPFARIAAELGCPEEQVLARTAFLRGPEGLIREISGLFDAAALGYRQALAAFRVPEARLDAVGRTVASHPGVSHCYARGGAYNLWFTLAVSPRSALGLERTAETLALRCGAESHALLPVLRCYKLDARFYLGDDEAVRGHGPQPAVASSATASASRSESPALSEEQVRAVRALQQDLPTRRDPFAPLAAAADMGADSLLVHAADFLARGRLRRYAAVVHHRLAGAKANVMVAWEVAPERADQAGRRCAELPEISHCYLRAARPDWPYSLYTMVHGGSEGDCRKTIEKIAAAAGLDRRAELWTGAEYKKQRVRLFGPEEAVWEQGAERG